MVNIELESTANLEMQSDRKKLQEKTATAIRNFFSLPLTQNGRSHETAEIDHVTSRVWEIINRNNVVSEILSSERFQEVKERKSKLRGSTELGAIWCVDGRLDGMSMGVLVDIWEVPAGMIVVEEVSHGLIPNSSELQSHIKADAENDKELLEVAFAHFDSGDKTHGCAANAIIFSEIKKDKSPKNIGQLTFEDLAKIKRTENAEDANLLILGGTSVPATTQYYNRVRETAGKPTLERVAIAALYDTATMGVILRTEEAGDLSATELTNKYKASIEQKLSIEFGEYNHNFTDAKLLLDFSEKKVQIMEHLLTNGEDKDFFNEVNEYIQKAYSNLTPGQSQALRYLMTESVAFQYLSGLSEVPEGGPNHPFSSHSEGYMGLSIRGEFIGKFDTQQAFGSTASDAADAIEQLKTEYAVMDKTGIDTDKPRIVFICNSISSHDFKNDEKAIKRASSNNRQLMKDILEDSDITNWITLNRLVIVNVLVDDTTGEVLSVLDHSSSY